jgi:hypothetical protein
MSSSHPAWNENGILDISTAFMVISWVGSAFNTTTRKRCTRCRETTAQFQYMSRRDVFQEIHHTAWPPGFTTHAARWATQRLVL